MASSTTTTVKPIDLLHDFTPFLVVHKNGRIERLQGEDFVHPSQDEETGVQSKDVVVVSTPELKLSARLFLPKAATPGKKLPLLIYVHGGGFLVNSPFSSLYNNYLNRLVAEANVVAVSVNYRLAPEHPISTAYEDSWLTIKWALDGLDEWIKDYADMGRVFLGGDSAGGNIVHHMGIRVGLEKLDGFKLRGIFLNCPYFWGEERIGNEARHYEKPLIYYIDDLWRYTCPSSLNCDDPWFNPIKDPKFSSLGCEKVLVYVGEKDILRDRGWYYKEELIKNGWKEENIEIFDVEGEDHVSDVLNPFNHSAIATMKKVGFFLNK